MQITTKNWKILMYLTQSLLNKCSVYLQFYSFKLTFYSFNKPTEINYDNFAVFSKGLFSLANTSFQ